MDKVEIRQMDRGDLEGVVRIEKQIFSNPWSEKSFRDAMASSDNCYLVAVFQGQILGYCGLWCSWDCADLCNLAVTQAFQKQRLGSELLLRGIALVKEKGVQRVLLEVRQSNIPAIGLYTKLGFRKIGVRPGYYSHPVEDGILMEKVVE